MVGGSTADHGHGECSAPNDPASLILKRPPIGSNLEDYDVLDDGVIVGRILFISAAGPADRQWMWASGHNGELQRATYGYAPTREDAKQAFARSWRGGEM